MSVIDKIKQDLDLRLFTSLDPVWLRHCVDFLNQSLQSTSIPISQLTNMVHDQVLFSSLDSSTQGCFPPNICLTNATKLPSNYLVQVEEFVNINETIEKRFNHSIHRTLKMTLFDGKQWVSALEFTHIPQLSVEMFPGVKIIVKSPKVSHGMLVLTKEDVIVLGGKVDFLVDKVNLIKQKNQKRTLPKEWEDELGDIAMYTTDSTLENENPENQSESTNSPQKQQSIQPINESNYAYNRASNPTHYAHQSAAFNGVFQQKQNDFSNGIQNDKNINSNNNISNNSNNMLTTNRPSLFSGRSPISLASSSISTNQSTRPESPFKHIQISSNQISNNNNNQLSNINQVNTINSSNSNVAISSDSSISANSSFGAAFSPLSSSLSSAAAPKRTLLGSPVASSSNISRLGMNNLSNRLFPSNNNTSSNLNNSNNQLNNQSNNQPNNSIISNSPSSIHSKQTNSSESFSVSNAAENEVFSFSKSESNGSNTHHTSNHSHTISTSNSSHLMESDFNEYNDDPVEMKLIKSEPFQFENNNNNKNSEVPDQLINSKTDYIENDFIEDEEVSGVDDYIFKLESSQVSNRSVDIDKLIEDDPKFDEFEEERKQFSQEKLPMDDINDEYDNRIEIDDDVEEIEDFNEVQMQPKSSTTKPATAQLDISFPSDISEKTSKSSASKLSPSRLDDDWNQNYMIIDENDDDHFEHSKWPHTRSLVNSLIYSSSSTEELHCVQVNTCKTVTKPYIYEDKFNWSVTIQDSSGSLTCFVHPDVASHVLEATPAEWDVVLSSQEVDKIVPDVIAKGERSLETLLGLSWIPQSRQCTILQILNE